MSEHDFKIAINEQAYIIAQHELDAGGWLVHIVDPGDVVTVFPGPELDRLIEALIMMRAWLAEGDALSNE